MRFASSLAAACVLTVLSTRAGHAHADAHPIYLDGDGAPSAVPTSAPATPAATLRRDPLALATARDFVTRARVMDEVATADERAAKDLEKRLGVQRAEVTRLRRTASARPAERIELTAKADALEAESIVTEAELEDLKQAATDQRRAARELRERAVRVVRGLEATNAWRAAPLHI